MNEAEKEEFKVYKEVLFTAIRERFQTLPTISALAATLLVVATFNPEIIPITNFVRVILAILLVIIPISLFGYLLELRIAENNAVKWFERYGKIKQVGFIKILAYLPWILLSVFSLVILSMIVLILC